VRKVIPELVHQSGEYYGVDYSEMIGLFVEAFKEQQKLIEKQDRSISDFRNRIENLEEKNRIIASQHSAGYP
jgi:hypothetical protein